MLNIHTQFICSYYEMLKWFIRKLKTNPNLIFLNEANWVAEDMEINNWYEEKKLEIGLFGLPDKCS